jgi:hypothetical protein
MCDSLDPSTYERTYLMGHRLVAFFSDALPSHPEYMDQAMEQHRNETIRDLVWIQQRLEEIALKIDEEQLNRYITDEFVPEPDENDDSTTCSSSSSGEEKWSHEQDAETHEEPPHLISSGGAWESFDGWSLDTSSEDETPQLLESDTSLTSSNDTGSLEDTPRFDLPPMSLLKHPDLDQSTLTDDMSEPDCSDPGLDLELLDDDEEYKYDCTTRADLLAIQQAVRSSVFLRKIAEQDVAYEWDSEAFDSWDQGVDEVYSECDVDSIDSLPCNPARIVLEDIGINNGHVSAASTCAPSRRLTKSLTFDEDMPDDEAKSCSVWKRPHPSSYSYNFADEDEAPDDEAISWASHNSATARQTR